MKKIKMIKVVFLDIDNTLLSFSGYVKEAMKDGFSKYGLKEYEESMYETFELINSGLWRDLENGILTFEELTSVRWNKIFKALDIDFDGIVFEKYFREKLFDSAVLIDGALELLEYLKDKYTLCVASNGPYDQQLNRLKVGKIYDYFRFYFISSKFGHQKPTEEFFKCCFDELRSNGYKDLKPEETIIIGDSVSADISGGKKYGMKTCLYSCNVNTDVADSSADYVVSNLSDIKNIL